MMYKKNRWETFKYELQYQYYKHEDTITICIFIVEFVVLGYVIVMEF